MEKVRKIVEILYKISLWWVAFVITYLALCIIVALTFGMNIP